MSAKKAADDFLTRTKTRDPAILLTEWLPKMELKGGPALDLGCGSGAEAEYLARNGFSVDAVDISDVAVKFTQERCAGLDVNAILADFRRFDIKPEHYEAAVANNSLPFISNDEAAKLLKAVQDGLRPGGVAFISVFGPEHSWGGRPDMSFWTRDEFGALWENFVIHHLEEYKGMWPLASGEEIFQHRIDLVAQKLSA